MCFRIIFGAWLATTGLRGSQKCRAANKPLPTPDSGLTKLGQQARQLQTRIDTLHNAHVAEANLLQAHTVACQCSFDSITTRPTSGYPAKQCSMRLRSPHPDIPNLIKLLVHVLSITDFVSLMLPPCLRLSVAICGL